MLKYPNEFFCYKLFEFKIGGKTQVAKDQIASSSSN
jgi:hypothetical protein